MTKEQKMGFGWLMIAFFYSRIVYYYFFDLNFNSESLNFFVQFVDPALLKSDLLRSLFYLHGQPPLFNLFLGIVLKIFPESYTVVFHGIYILVGVVLACSLLHLMNLMGVKRPLAIILSVAYCIAPSTAQYENWLFYTYPLTALLVLAAVFLHKYVSKGLKRDGIFFFSILALISLTRGIFNMAWFVVLVFFLLFFLKDRRREILLLSGIPLFLVVLFSLKQFLLFGSFGTGQAFFGPNLAHRMAREIPPDQKEALLYQKKISPLIFEFPHKSISNFKKYIGDIPATGIPVLDMNLKSTGAPNNHHIGYLRLAKLYLRNATNLLINRPEFYVKSFRRPLLEYFLPSDNDDWAKFKHDSPQLIGLYRFFDYFYCGQLKANGVGWFLVVSLPLLFIFGMVVLFGKCQSMQNRGFPFRITLLFAVFNIAFIAAITVPVTWGDFNRYRFNIDPFYTLLLGLFLTSIKDKWKNRLNRI